MEIVNSLSDIQDSIMECYAGADWQLFRSIAPWCSTCEKLAISPYNCAICEDAYLCGPCHD